MSKGWTPVIWARPIALALALCLTTWGCGQAKKDRAKTAAQRKIQSAIAEYSAASEKANSLHGKVISQFQRANQSKDLDEYRGSLRRDVLPAIDQFLSMLQMMPTKTPELQKIHTGLVAAYQEARKQITEFTDRLQTAKDLGRFNEIRNLLQQRVTAYQSQLSQYYTQYNRRLQLAENQSQVDPASGATPTAAPAPPGSAQSVTATTP
ncbi:MAG TPA: hypothetical protein DCQ06_04360 [Myxococcales bacterium]|nr:hypothetical protein [Myxococcales bacterium]